MTTLTVYFSMKGETIAPGMKIVNLKKATGATIRSGLAITGSRASSSEGAVKKWLTSNGIL